MPVVTHKHSKSDTLLNSFAFDNRLYLDSDGSGLTPSDFIWDVAMQSSDKFAALFRALSNDVRLTCLTNATAIQIRKLSLEF